MKALVKRVPRYALYGGGALAGLLAVRWLWVLLHGKSDLGDDELGALGDTERMMARADVQVRKAKAREKLSDYRQAEGLESFWKGPSSNAEAYFYAAFWLSVAARTTGVWALSGKASTALAKGKAAYAIPGSSKMRGAAQSILKTAAADIASAAPNRKQASAILAALKQQGSTTSARAEEASAQSPEGIAAGTASKSVSDVATVVEVARGFVTGEKPRGFADVQWWLWKWGLRAGAVVAGLLVAKVYLGGHVRRAVEATRHLTSGVQQARAALTDRSAA